MCTERGFDSKSVHGRTALHFTAMKGDTNIVDFLLGRGIDINSKDKNGKTALHYEIENDDIEFVENLLDRNIDISS